MTTTNEIPTPRTDSEDRPYPSPEHAQRIKFEGCECVVIGPEDYEALYSHARTLERETIAQAKRIEELEKALRASSELLEEVRTGEDFEVTCWERAETNRALLNRQP